MAAENYRGNSLELLLRSNNLKVRSPESPENVQATRLVIALCPSVLSVGPVPFCITFTVQRELNLPDTALPDVQETAAEGSDSKSIKSRKRDRKLMYRMQVENAASKTVGSALRHHGTFKNNCQRH